MINLIGKTGTSLFRYILKFGFLKGTMLFFRHEINNFEQIHLIFLQDKLWVRNNSTDMKVFVEIFVFEEYNIDLKIKPKIIIDAGSNIGLSSIYFAHKYPNAKVLAIEPDPDNFKQLIKNTLKYDRIETLEGAIWNKTGNLDITGTDAWNFIVQPDNNGEIRGYTLDYIMEKFKIDTIDLLKIDIEGSEAALFESGYTNWLNKTKVMIIEIHDWINLKSSKNLFKAISGFNFTCRVQNNLLVFQRY